MSDDRKDILQVTNDVLAEREIYLTKEIQREVIERHKQINNTQKNLRQNFQQFAFEQQERKHFKEQKSQDLVLGVK